MQPSLYICCCSGTVRMNKRCHKPSRDRHRKNHTERIINAAYHEMEWLLSCREMITYTYGHLTDAGLWWPVLNYSYRTEAAIVTRVYEDQLNLIFSPTISTWGAKGKHFFHTDWWCAASILFHLVPALHWRAITTVLSEMFQHGHFDCSIFV